MGGHLKAAERVVTLRRAPVVGIPPNEPYPSRFPHNGCHDGPDLLSGRGSLHQVLGVAFGLAVLVGTTIATGIMRTPGEVAAHLPTTTLFIGVWVLGGIYALLGAMSMAEGGVITRRSGGQYPIVHRA